MFESLKHIKTTQDIKLQKARMRYEAMLAENKMMESFHSIGQVFTIIYTFRKVTSGVSYVYQTYQKISDFLSRLFGGSKKEKKENNQEETVRY